MSPSTSLITSSIITTSQINQIANNVQNSKIVNIINNQIELENRLNQNNLKLSKSNQELLNLQSKIKQVETENLEKESIITREQEANLERKMMLLKKYEIQVNEISDVELNQGMNLVKKYILAEKFYGIFHKVKPRNDELNYILANFMESNPFIEEKINGKTVVKIQSMIPIINFMKMNQQITLCKFMGFELSLHNLSSLCEYLVTDECKIQAIGFKKDISPDFKSLLNSIRPERPFRVVYQ